MKTNAAILPDELLYLRRAAISLCASDGTVDTAVVSESSHTFCIRTLSTSNLFARSPKKKDHSCTKTRRLE